jgi:hypothetical protein
MIAESEIRDAMTENIEMLVVYMSACLPYMHNKKCCPECNLVKAEATHG